MSLQHEQTSTEHVANSGLGSSEETSKLLIEAQGTNNNNNAVTIPILQKAHSYSSSNGPTVTTTTTPPLITQQSLTSSSSSSKPVLIRQDRATSSYLASPQLSALGTSEETSDDDNAKTISYQLMPSGPTNRCRTCHSHERRSSISPSSVIQIPRSASKESIGRLSPSSALQIQGSTIPPVYITGSPTNNTSRVIRQSSQPEASTLSCCNNSCSHAQQPQTSSLRQLRDPSDPIAGIATETLRVSNFDLNFKKFNLIY